MKNLLLLLRSKLGRRTVIYVLLLSSTVTLFFTSLQLYLEYRYGIVAIEQEVNRIAKTSLKPLEENLWLLNLSSINLMLEGIMHNKDIVYVEISDENGGKLLAKGNIPDENFRLYTIPLNYMHNKQKVYLGQIKIITTLENLYTRLTDTIIYILITQSVKTFLVSIFTIFIVWLLISKHLATIQRYTKNIRLDRPQKDLELDRQRNNWTTNDELSNLVDAINMMRREIYESYSQIEHLSMHDPLTNLPNRRCLEERLKQEVECSGEKSQYGALLFMDLDHFKFLNDSLGHSIGDQLLIELSQRLITVTGEENLVARIGGDEFIVLLNNLSDKAEQACRMAHDIAWEIQSCISRDTVIDGKKYKISISIGIALFDRNACDTDTILKQADNALQESKEQGRNKITWFHPEMQQKTDRWLQTEQKLHIGVRKQQFVVHYQPKYDQFGTICSAEALMRWQPSDDRMIPPNVFIPIAEETGLIIDIGNQIISTVLQTVAENFELIRKSGLKSLAINVSPRQFVHPDFYEHLISEVSKYNLDPSFFILEITEEAVIKNIETTIQTMYRLKKHGFRLSIDDFGTGYSSLGYLKDFPLDELKIDKSFIDHIVDKRNDLAIALSIIEMAKNLNLDVVAEGVETREQFELLVDINCHIFQGFFFLKPLETKPFLDLLSAEDEG